MTTREWSRACWRPLQGQGHHNILVGTGALRELRALPGKILLIRGLVNEEVNERSHREWGRLWAGLAMGTACCAVTHKGTAAGLGQCHQCHQCHPGATSYHSLSHSHKRGREGRSGQGKGGM